MQAMTGSGIYAASNWMAAALSASPRAARTLRRWRRTGNILVDHFSSLMTPPQLSSAASVEAAIIFWRSKSVDRSI